VASFNLNLGSPMLRKGLLTLLISIKLYAVIILWSYAAVKSAASLWRKIPSTSVRSIY
jgi:hypothetical protein